MKKEITKEELTIKLNKTILRPFNWLVILSLICIIVSPFIFIWQDWTITWKLGLSGIFGFIIFGTIHKIMKIAINKSVKEWASAINKKNSIK